MEMVVKMDFCYVFYDIPDDRIRLKVADALKDYGLLRLQKSVFVGQLSRNRAEELSEYLRDIIGSKEADVRIIFSPPSYQRKNIIVKEMHVIDEREVIVV